MRPALLLLALSLSTASLGHARRLIVDPSNPNCSPTCVPGPTVFCAIQPAIACANPGDTVVVKAGIYTEHLDFLGKDILLTSEPIGVGSPATTVIRGVAGDDLSIINFHTGETNAARVFGFTLRDETEGTYVVLSPTLDGWYGGAVYAYEASPTIENCTVTNNESEFGGGIYVEDETRAQILNNTIEANRAATHPDPGRVRGVGGGGIDIEGLGDSVIVRGNTIVNNWSEDVSGGINFHASTDICPNHCYSKVIIEQNVIQGNTCQGDWGGGVGITGNRARAVLKGNTITQNAAGSLAGWAGGIYAEGADTVRIRENTITFNTAPIRGGGVHLWNCRAALVIGNTVTDNTTGTNGGGLWIKNTPVAVFGNTILRNTVTGAQGAGGGLYLLDLPAVPLSRIGNDTRIEQNSAYLDGGGIYAKNSPFVLDLAQVTLNKIDGPLGADNTGGIVLDGDKAVTGNFCDIVGNENYNLKVINLPSGQQDARRNWWGSASGPGTTVLGPANVSPWAEASVVNDVVVPTIFETTRLPNTTSFGPFTVDSKTSDNTKVSRTDTLSWRRKVIGQEPPFQEVYMDRITNPQGQSWQYRGAIPQQGQPGTIQYYVKGWDGRKLTGTEPGAPPYFEFTIFGQPLGMAGSLRFLDAETGAILADRAEYSPTDFAMTPLGMALTDASSGQVVLLDPGTFETLRSFPSGGEQPSSLVFDEARGRWYVGNSGSNSVTVLSAEGGLLRTIATGAGPVALALAPAYNVLAVLNGGDNSLALVHTVRDSVVASLSLPAGPIAGALDGSGQLFALSRAAGTMTVVDLGRRAVRGSFAIAGYGARDVLSLPGDSLLAIVLEGSDAVRLVTPAGVQRAVIPVGESPYGCALSPDGGMLYVSNYGESTISRIDLASRQEVAPRLDVAPVHPRQLVTWGAPGQGVGGGAGGRPTPLAFGRRPAGPLFLEVQPNPVVDNAVIQFGPRLLGRTESPGAQASLSLYDLRGRHIRSLWVGGQQKGAHTMLWDGRDALGRRLAPGLYICRFQANGRSISRKVLIRR